MVYERMPWAHYSAPRVGKAELIVHLNTMPTQDKRKLWEAIKEKRPELAVMMTSNADLLAIKKAFSAEFVFTESEIKAIIP